MVSGREINPRRFISKWSEEFVKQNGVKVVIAGLHKVAGESYVKWAVVRIFENIVAQQAKTV